jgi:hypothetical protein
MPSPGNAPNDRSAGAGSENPESGPKDNLEAQAVEPRSDASVVGHEADDRKVQKSLAGSNRAMAWFTGALFFANVALLLLQACQLKAIDGQTKGNANRQREC